MVLRGAVYRMSCSNSILSRFCLDTRFTEVFMKTEEIETLLWGQFIWRPAEIMLYKHLVELNNVFPNIKVLENNINHT